MNRLEQTEVGHLNKKKQKLRILKIFAFYQQKKKRGVNMNITAYLQTENLCCRNSQAQIRN